MSDNQPIELKDLSNEPLNHPTKEHLIKTQKNIENRDINPKDLLKYASTFYIRAIPLIFNRINPILLHMISLYYISW